MIQLDPLSIGTRDKPVVSVMDSTGFDSRLPTVPVTTTTNDSLKVSLIIFFLNMMDYPMFFIFLSTKNDQGHLSDTKGYSGLVSNYVLPLRPTKTYGGGW